MQSLFKPYLFRVTAALAGVLALVWLYVALMPMAFMESGYPAWVAKSKMLQDCQLGDVAFFGDSRLEAGVIPALLPVSASNFGLAAGTAVEARSAATRAMACPTLPKQAVISLSPGHFGPLSGFFWLLSLRYGFIGPGELWATENLAQRLGDTKSFATPTPDGLSGRLRDWLYELRFPSLSFGNLVQGRVFGRYDSNQSRLATVLDARGWSEYTPAGGFPADQADYTATKLQAAELEAMLAMLRDRGLDVKLLVMPESQSAPVDRDSEAAYLAYLGGLAQRFPGVELVSAAVPRWPDTFFADGVHLDGAGAKLFSSRLAACMGAGRLAPGCDLGWHSDTAGR